MAELMSLIALVSMLAAVVAGWYLWRAMFWHPPGGLAQPRAAAGAAAWPVSGSSAGSTVDGTDAKPMSTSRRPRRQPCNHHVNAGRWSSDRHSDSDPAARFSLPGFGGGRRQDTPGETDPAVTREELRLAVRAVLVHTAQQWPGGVYCSNDRSPFPCRMRHWGEQVLLAAGWDRENIEAMARQADAGLPPWLAGAGDVNQPPR
jgi:hypothetical protein